MPNRLAGSTSPYLLQHQNNPVAWFPWGNEAIEKAQREDKPIFLSIGYAACHWCHVMEHESFENAEIAEYLNQHFVSIKVDREQRPDLDHIYMQAVQMLTGSGGWPMSVFLTPAMQPFYAGTYWPPQRKWNHPGFGEVLQAVSNAWQTNRAGVLAQSDEITKHLHSHGASKQLESEDAVEQSTDMDDAWVAAGGALLARADHWLEQAFDDKWGGFGGAPKFPHAMDLQLLMRLQVRQPDPARLHRIERTLDGMARGGIYDHLGGGFERYSVDERWLVPHFEKMLYDNALLASAYLDAYRLTGETDYAEIVRETLDYILTDLTHPQGGFYSTRDADSEGEEGKFYVWSREEILNILGSERGIRFCEAYGVTFGGNFEGANVLYLPEPLRQVADRLQMPLDALREQLQADRKRLLQVRDQRVWPGLDDKVLCSWNALMISAMAQAGVVLREDKYLAAAERAAAFLTTRLTQSDGRLLHVWRQDVGEIDGFLEDYSYLANALLTLFECTGNPMYLERVQKLMNWMLQNFEDASGGFFFTSSDAESLITRFKDVHDGSVPSGNAMAATVLARLASFLEEPRYAEVLSKCLRQARGTMHQSPGASGQMLQALDQAIGPNQQLVFVARDEASKLHALRIAFSKYRPNAIVIGSVVEADGSNLLEHTAAGSLVMQRPLRAGESIALYACIDHACGEPLHGWDAVEGYLANN